MTHTIPSSPLRVALTTPEAATYMGLAVSTLNKWRCHGGGPKYSKLGRAVRYRRPDLDRFMDETLQASCDEAK